MLICRTNAKLWMRCVEMQHPFTNSSSLDQSFTATASADSQLWQLGLCLSPCPHSFCHCSFFFRLFSNLLQSRWPWTSEPPSFLELQDCTTTLCFHLCFATPSVPWPLHHIGVLKTRLWVWTNLPDVRSVARGGEQLPSGTRTPFVILLPQAQPPAAKESLHADVMPARPCYWGLHIVPSACEDSIRKRVLALCLLTPEPPRPGNRMQSAIWYHCLWSKVFHLYEPQISIKWGLTLLMTDISKDRVRIEKYLFLKTIRTICICSQHSVTASICLPNSRHFLFKDLKESFQPR